MSRKLKLLEQSPKRYYLLGGTSMSKKQEITEAFDEANAAALAEMLVDPETSEAVRLQIINELNEEAAAETFFETLFREELSIGCCPKCGHSNHWLIPEDDLGQMGWVTHTKDQRVHQHTTAETCVVYQESCSKKKTTA